MNTKFNWQEDQNESQLRELCSKSILQYSDFTKPFVNITNGYAIRDILNKGKVNQDLSASTWRHLIASTWCLLNPAK